MRTAVCDTGPILHLIEAGLLGLLQNVGDVYIPKSVDSEMSDLRHHWEKERPEWIQIEPLRSVYDVGNLEVQGLAKWPSIT